MRVSVLPITLASALLSSIANGTPVPDATSDSASTLDQLAALATQNEAAALEDAATKRSTASTCTLKNLSVRREWTTLSNSEKIAYSDAVLCLQNKAALTPTSLVPGVRTRYDDFVATHINQTLTIHYTGNFLSWHRFFTWNYEQALRNECGYTGTQPYWNWGCSANDVPNYPIFDGSATSMGGNGEYIADKGPITLTLPGYPDVVLPAGTGGGCVTSGPFKNMTVNLGPVDLPKNDGTVATGTGLDYNPRCLSRDLTTAINAAYANMTSILSLILNSEDINTFQMTMQGVPGSGIIGVHGGGHYTIGGDPADDVFTSPGDPVFFLHHGMIDRVWWIWQNLDLKNRQDAISGTKTFLNLPPSANATLDDIIDLGYVTSYTPKIADLMSTTSGPFCYTYL